MKLLKSMDTTGKTVEDVWHVEGVAKGTQTTWKKIVPMKLIPQTARKNTLLSQDNVTYTKKRENTGNKV